MNQQNLFKKTHLLLLVLLIVFFVSSNAQYTSKMWVSDNGDGTYKNPVINADYSDPDAIRVGNDFYLIASSFTCVPGIPILHSRDLVNWSILNYALYKQLPEDVYNDAMQMKGVWAPSIRYHNGEFYIYYPDPDYGIYMVKAKNPADKWSKPVLILAGKGIIDPCPFWDDNGNAYLVNAWAGSRAGVNSLLSVYKMNTEGTEVTDEGKIIYDGHEVNYTVEGPKLYKRSGYYYIFAPAGGVSQGWQLVLRSKDIYGPYQEKIVMDKGTTLVNGPHQGAWVDTQTGEDWFLHFQDKGAYGRVVHLQPMQWINDWPVIGDDKDGDSKGEPVLTFKKPNVNKSYHVCTPVENDEFNSDTLGLQWQWNGNPKITWMSLVRGNGCLRLYPVKLPQDFINLWTIPNLLLQKFPATNFTATTRLQLTDIALFNGEGCKTGLIIMGRDYSYLSLERTGKDYKLTQITCLDADRRGVETVIAERQLPGKGIYLRVNVSAPDALCKFSYSTDGTGFTPFGKEFKAREGGWIGAKVGIFFIATPGNSNQACADYDWFRVEK